MVDESGSVGRRRVGRVSVVGSKIVAWYDPLFAPVVGYDWGGTDYLEEHRLAHEKYIERLNRWAASPAFPHWEMQERDAAIADANYVYSITDSAAGYWGSLPAFWSSYAESLYLSIRCNFGKSPIA